MTFEEHMRVIELKELNSDDQRKVFTKLVCVYFENKNGNEAELEDFQDKKCMNNGFRPQMSNNSHDVEPSFRRSFSASNLTSEMFSISPG